MNCSNFETTIDELARNQMMDAAARDRAMAHIGNCARCSARLADERVLAAGLKALAAADDAKSAPAVVETVLLAAFRRQADSPVVSLVDAAPVRSRLGRWVWAAAASILLASGLLASGSLVYRAVQNQSGNDNRVVIKEKEDKPTLPTAPLAVEAEQRPKSAPLETPRTSLATLIEKTSRGGKKTQNPPFIIRESITSYANDYEEATDFVYVNYEDPQTPMESGQVIRVQMPRSALARFGLPVNLERADVPVKADVLVGDDGLARAIRFVR